MIMNNQLNYWGRGLRSIGPNSNAKLSSFLDKDNRVCLQTIAKGKLQRLLALPSSSPPVFRSESLLVGTV